jgi:hypothetical protein
MTIYLADRLNLKLRNISLVTSYQKEADLKVFDCFNPLAMFRVDAEGPCNSASVFPVCSSQVQEKSVIDGTGETAREMAATTLLL